MVNGEERLPGEQAREAEGLVQSAAPQKEDKSVEDNFGREEKQERPVDEADEGG